MGLTKFFKKSPEKECPWDLSQKGDRELNASACFGRIFDYIERKNLSEEEKLDTYTFLIDVVANDLEASFFAKTIYREDVDPFFLQNIFPVSNFFSEKPKTEISVEGKHILTLPYSLDKLCKASSDIKKDGGYCPEKNEASSVYIPEFNLIVVVNGRHHVSAAKIRKKNLLLPGVEKSIDFLFPSLEVSDKGHFWILNHSKCKILDQRFALLYLLAKEREKLKKKQLPSF